MVCACKSNAEANVFRRGRPDHMIDTPIGRIGIGICDNQFAAHLRLMQELQADLILMPHAWPTPSKAAGLVSETDVATQQTRMIELPALYARSLGVPVVFVNQIGPLLPVGGILAWPGRGWDRPPAGCYRCAVRAPNGAPLTLSAMPARSR